MSCVYSVPSRPLSDSAEFLVSVGWQRDTGFFVSVLSKRVDRVEDVVVHRGIASAAAAVEIARRWAEIPEGLQRNLAYDAETGRQVVCLA